MRAIASIKSHPQYKKALIYQGSEGVHLFLYKSQKDSACDSDLWFENLNRAHTYCERHFDIQLHKWHSITDPPPNYRDDFIRPVPANLYECHMALIQAVDGNLNWVKALLSAGADPNGMPLIMAIQCGEPKIVQALIDSGADVNLDYANTTPLIRAVTSTYPEIVEILIKAGANVNKKANNGNTPLKTALQINRINATDQERTSIIRMLEETGAQI